MMLSQTGSKFYDSPGMCPTSLFVRGHFFELQTRRRGEIPFFANSPAKRNGRFHRTIRLLKPLSLRFPIPGAIRDGYDKLFGNPYE